MIAIALACALAGPAATDGPSRCPAFMPPRIVTLETRHEIDLDSVPRRGGPDPWLGEDKLKHFFMSFAVATFAASGARMAGLSRRPSLVVGATVGAAAGVWKEARDRVTGGDVSARDLAWDGVGVAAGTVLAAHAR